jgi:hypothetical protein
LRKKIFSLGLLLMAIALLPIGSSNQAPLVKEDLEHKIEKVKTILKNFGKKRTEKGS